MLPPVLYPPFTKAFTLGRYLLFSSFNKSSFDEYNCISEICQNRIKTYFISLTLRAKLKSFFISFQNLDLDWDWTLKEKLSAIYENPNNDPEIKHLLRTLINPQSYSFMSGHATTSTFFAVFVVLLLRDIYKYIYFVLLFPLIFAYSRLYLGVHFPIDICVGILIGTTLAKLYFMGFKKLDKKIFT